MMDLEMNQMSLPSRIRALAVWGWALILPETPHNTESLWVGGEETFCFLKPEYQSGDKPLTSGVTGIRRHH